MKDFDFNTIDNFDDHIEKSIPKYDILINAIKSISQYFMVENSSIYDLGCSTGKLLLTLDTKCKKIGYDVATLLPSEDGFYSVDLNKEFKLENACIVYSIFTMQFLDPSKRSSFLDTIYKGLNKDGALLICEKVYQESGKIQEIMSFSHYDYKLGSFSSDAILKKERDLRHIMKPCETKELDKMLKSAGFKTSTFWQMFNFKGIIAIK